jgi:hypothetical protein
VTVATKRACRDCGAPLARTHLNNQCVECQGKTMWRPVTPGGFAPIVREMILEPPPPPKPPACAPGKHPGCKHFQRLISKLIEEHEDAGMCFVCGGEWDETAQRIPHKSDCELLPWEPAPGTEGE